MYVSYECSLSDVIFIHCLSFSSNFCSDGPILYISSDLKTGITRASSCFSSPPLISPPPTTSGDSLSPNPPSSSASLGGRFEIDAIEVWGFHHLEAADGQASVYLTKKEEEGDGEREMNILLNGQTV